MKTTRALDLTAVALPALALLLGTATACDKLTGKKAGADDTPVAATEIVMINGEVEI